MKKRLKGFSRLNGRAHSTLPECLSYWAATRPHELAFGFISNGDRLLESWTYGELQARVQRLISVLEDHSIEGDRILLIYPSSLEFIAAYMACLCSGRIAVPTYTPRNSTVFQRIQGIIDDAQARLLLCNGSAVEQFKNELSGMKQQWMATENLNPELSKNEYSPNLESLAMLQYTSGSTGKPKGVMVTHSNLISNQRLIKQSFGHNEETVVVGWLPLFHDMGLIGNILQPLFLGRPCYFMSPESFLRRPLNWLWAISKFGATTSGGPNFAYDLCSSFYQRTIKKNPNQQDWASLNLEKWKLAFVGAEPVRERTLDRFSNIFKQFEFSGRSFYPCYGLAESTLIFTGGQCGEGANVARVLKSDLKQSLITLASNTKRQSDKAFCSIVYSGRTRLTHEYIIVDPSSKSPLPDHRVGEVWISGASITQGYWRNQESTEQTFNVFSSEGQGPFFRTGDLGFRSGNLLAITGRLKDMIVVRGQNHWASDIEETVGASHSLLREDHCAAFSINFDENTQEKVVVVQELNRRGMPPTELVEVREAVIEKVIFDF